MCVSRVHEVVAVREAEVDVRDADGSTHAASLLAYEGDALSAGDYVDVHSGYALSRLDRVEAVEVQALIDAARRAGLDRER